MKRRRFTVGLGIVAVVAVVAVGVLVAVVLGGGDGLPSSIDGVQRLHSADAQRFEKLLADTEIMGTTLKGAIYGTAAQAEPELVLEVFSGMPSDTSVDDMMSGFTATAAGSTGGTVDDASRVAETRGGIDYSCVRMDGSVLAPTATVCLWNGDPAGALIDLRSGDMTKAVDVAQEVHDELG